jgi:acetylglutamate kinase
MSIQFSSVLDFTSLRGALPYIKTFRDKIFVIKMGGDICEDSVATDQVIEQLSLLSLVGIKIILVHGGGKHATSLSSKLGVESEFISGRRVTSKEMLDVTKMSFAGQLNTDLIAAFRKHDIRAVGLSGIDGGLIKATKRSPKKVYDQEQGKEREVDFGFVADIESVDGSVISHLLAGNYIPVICSLASDNAGQVLNINADTLASRIASSVGATKLCILGTVDGVLQDVNDPQTLLSILSKNDVEKLLKGTGISGGMIPKLTTSLDAIGAGVPQVHIISGIRTDAILQEIFTNEGSGTMIVP